MPKPILDSNVLINHWWRFSDQNPATARKAGAMSAWADKLIETYGTKAIVTPVHIEVIAGATSSEDLEKLRAYLGRFEVIDQGNIPRSDWEEAKRFAQRVPHNKKFRQLADCLIRAIANRLNYEVFTVDRGFPPRHRAGRS